MPSWTRFRGGYRFGDALLEKQGDQWVLLWRGERVELGRNASLADAEEALADLVRRKKVEAAAIIGAGALVSRRKQAKAKRRSKQAVRRRKTAQAVSEAPSEVSVELALKIGPSGSKAPKAPPKADLAKIKAPKAPRDAASNHIKRFLAVRRKAATTAARVAKGTAKSLERAIETLRDDFGSWGPSAQDAFRRRLRVSLGEQLQSVADEAIRVRSRSAKQAVTGVRQYLLAMDEAVLGTKQVLPKIDLEAILDRATEEARERAARSVARYASGVIDDVEKIAELELTPGMSMKEARDVLRRAAKDSVKRRAWMAERLARTEANGAYNDSVLGFLRAADRQGERMYKRLAATFDERTGADSYILHGQTVPVDKPFWDAYHGRHYMAPPNRANDREVIVPWRGAWGTPPETPEVELPRDEPRPGVADAAQRKLTASRKQLEDLKRTISAIESAMRRPGANKWETVRVRELLRSAKIQARAVQADIRALKERVGAAR